MHMSRSINSAVLNKKYILSKVSQLSIFAKYLNLQVNVIQRCIDTGELICSPLRQDIHPTVGFRYDNKGRLKLRDFAGFFWGDCFDAAALIISRIENKKLNVADKNDFIRILQHITFSFKNIFYGSDVDETINSSIRNALNDVRNQKQFIELVVRDWNEIDIKYWNEFGVSVQYLNKHFVYPVDQYYINRNINPEPKYYYNPKDTCYVYILGFNKNTYPDIKLYFPDRPHGTTRFITNCNHLEGIYDLYKNNYDFIVITKSTKDRVSLGCTLETIIPFYREDVSINKYTIGIINIPHETYRLRETEYNWLQSKLSYDGKLISLMDNDRTGVEEAQWLRKRYNIIPILIPRYLSCKDFAELRSKYDITTITNYIRETINFINNEKDYKHIGQEQVPSIKPF